MRLAQFATLLSVASVSNISAGSPICSGPTTTYSCESGVPSSPATLALCYNDILESQILVFNGELAHQVGTEQDADGNTIHESDLVRLVVSPKDGTATFVDKEKGITTPCQGHLTR
jgi:hypothetical protein